MTPDEFAAAGEHAAEILRPGAIHGALQQDASDLPGAQLLRVRRDADERVDLPVDEKLLFRGADDPLYIFARVEPDLRGHQSNVDVRGVSKARDPDSLPLEVADAADAFVRQQFDAADMYAGQHRNRDAAPIAQVPRPTRDILIEVSGIVANSMLSLLMGLRPSAASGQ